MSISPSSIYTYPVPTLSDGTYATTKTPETSTIADIRERFVEVLGSADDAKEAQTYYGQLKTGLDALNNILDKIKIPNTEVEFIDPNNLATTFANLKNDAFYTAAQTINGQRIDENCREGFLAYRNYLKTIVSAFERIYGYLEECRKALEALQNETDSDKAHVWITRLDIYEQFLHDEFKELRTYYIYNNDTKQWEKTSSAIDTSQLPKYEDIPYYNGNCKVASWHEVTVEPKPEIIIAYKITENGELVDNNGVVFIDENGKVIKPFLVYRANSEGRLVDKDGNIIKSFFYQVDEQGAVKYNDPKTTEQDFKIIKLITKTTSLMTGYPEVDVYSRQTGEKINTCYINSEGLLVKWVGNAWRSYSPKCEVMIRFVLSEGNFLKGKSVEDGSENGDVDLISASQSCIKITPDTEPGQSITEITIEKTEEIVNPEVGAVFYQVYENGKIVRGLNTQEIHQGVPYEYDNGSFIIDNKKYRIMNSDSEELYKLSIKEPDPETGPKMELSWNIPLVGGNQEATLSLIISKNENTITIDNSEENAKKNETVLALLKAVFVEVNESDGITPESVTAQPMIEAQSRELQPLRETQVACKDTKDASAKRQLDVFRAVTLMDRLRYIRYYYKLILEAGATDYSVFPNSADMGYPCLPDVQSTKATEDTKSLGAMEVFYVGYLTDRDGPVNAVSSFFEVKTEALRNNLSLQSQRISTLNLYLDFINAGLDLLNTSQSNGGKFDGEGNKKYYQKIPDGAILALTYLCGRNMYNLFEAPNGKKYLVLPEVNNSGDETGNYLLVLAEDSGKKLFIGDAILGKVIAVPGQPDLSYRSNGFGLCYKGSGDKQFRWVSGTNYGYPIPLASYYVKTGSKLTESFGLDSDGIESLKYKLKAEPLSDDATDTTTFKLPTRLECNTVLPTSVKNYDEASTDKCITDDEGKIIENAESDHTSMIKSWTDAFSNKSQYINTSIDTINTDVSVDRSKIDTLDSLTSTFRSRAQDTYLNTVANIRG